jgi:hypothetical protein
MIQETLSKVVYVADGEQRRWDIPFEFYKIEDVGFYVSTDSGKTSERITQNIEFEEDGKYFIYPTEDSKLPLLEAGTLVLLLRETENTQLEDSSEIYFKSKDIERGLDNLTMQVQDLARDAYRAVKVSHFSKQSPEQFAESVFEAERNASEAAAKASLSEQNADSSASSAASASANAVAASELAKSNADNSLRNAERAEQAAADSNMHASNAAESANTAATLLQEVSNSIYNKTQVDAKISGLQAEIDTVESSIPSVREEFNQGLSELQSQITAQSTAIAGKQEKGDYATVSQVNAKQDKLVAGPNITIDGNVISATGAGESGSSETEWGGITGDINAQTDLTNLLSNTESKIRADVNEADSELQAQITSQATAIAEKQDKLTAGEGITIDGNVISATGGEGGGSAELPDNVYTQDNLVAGDNIEIKEVVNPNVIDENCILCMHFDNDNKDSSLYSDLSDSTGLTTEYNSTSKFGTASAYVNAGAVYSPKFAEINNELTIDYWAHTSLNPNAAGAQVSIGNFGFSALGSFSQPQFYLQLNSNSIKWPFNYDVSLIKEGWNHFAGVFLKDENGQIVYRFFVNGKKVLQETSGQYAYFSNDYDLSFINFLVGYGIDEFRVTKKAVWLDDFIPPTEPYTKGEGGAKKAISAIIPPVELPSDVYRQSNLLGGKDIEIIPEPVDGGIDENTLACWNFDKDTNDEVNGLAFSSYADYAKVSTDYQCLGDGVGNLYHSSGKWTFDVGATADWTIEGFFMLPDTRGCYLGRGDYYSSTERLSQCYLRFDTTKLRIYDYATEVAVYEKDFGIYNWVHLALQSKSGKIQSFCDGVKVMEVDAPSGGFSGGMFAVTSKYLGRFYADAVRISNIARYTEDFTPPTKPYRKAEPTGNYLINFTGEAGSAGGAGASFPLFYHTFADHLFNDASWLRGDTFSWQSGDMYVSAYNHLVADYEGDGKQKNTTVYSWAFGEGYSGYNPYTLSEKPSNGSLVFWADIYSIKGILGKVVSFDEETNSFEYEDYKAGTTKIAISPTSKEKLSSFAIDTIGSTEITFYRADDGHKIVLADQESKVSDIYRSTGVAWYYVLDTENKRFKLPRTKWAFTGLRTGVGNFVEAGLPNITGTLGSNVFGAATGAFTYNNTNRGDSGGSNIEQGQATFNASLSSEVYGNSDTVQPNATEQYLYFYVGNTVRNQTEVEVGTVTEQLNGKQDVLGNNVDYVVETFRDGANWYRVYKSGWVEQGGNIPFAATGSWSAGNITFLKPMADTNYYLNGRGNWGDRQSCDLGVNSKTTTGCNVTVAINTLMAENGAWYVCGQGAI